MSKYINTDRLKEVPILNGVYDKNNANEDFIFGIETVMEYIDNMSGEDVYCPNCGRKVIKNKVI